jgi:hypothetical protein
MQRQIEVPPNFIFHTEGIMTPINGVEISDPNCFQRVVATLMGTPSVRECFRPDLITLATNKLLRSTSVWKEGIGHIPTRSLADLLAMDDSEVAFLFGQKKSSKSLDVYKAALGPLREALGKTISS